MSETWRLFIAIELPPDVLKAIERIQSDLKRVIPQRAARWTRPEGIHLTLKFLGDAPGDQKEALLGGMRSAAQGHAPFDLAVEGTGCFPDLKRPRVLWLGLTGDVQALKSLQAGVEKHIAPLGYPSEARGFSPHLTLARTAPAATRDEAAKIGEAALQRDSGLAAGWRVESISLMRSHLRPEGARYEQVGEARL